ncbi:hypothetical protein BT96DRAFT_1006664 [Gymnopus androsaceus JB14]|uniref:Uncharacterized protein n=1 Tax=Gymnopus androsaceus JB14 TaxID=1447944 RepID=A0A6A4GKB1_9AGAR|nr:hypothetical protein BT96DRAFT_1006664 [Gymnopus androsaceus JB14]
MNNRIERMRLVSVSIKHWGSDSEGASVSSSNNAGGWIPVDCEDRNESRALAGVGGSDDGAAKIVRFPWTGKEDSEDPNSSSGWSYCHLGVVLWLGMEQRQVLLAPRYNGTGRPSSESGRSKEKHEDILSAIMALRGNGIKSRKRSRLMRFTMNDHKQYANFEFFVCIYV